MNFDKLTIEKINLENQRIFLRVDFHKTKEELKVEPVIHTNKIMREMIMMETEDYEEWRTKPKPTQKLVDVVPTIKYLLEKGVKSIVICAHLGEPDEKVNHKNSVLPWVVELKEKLDQAVIYVPSCVGQQTETFCKNPEKGTIFFLENVFFHPEETGFYVDESGTRKPVEPAKIREFRAGLSRLADIYVNEAFSLTNKNYSSMSGEGFPIRAAGLLFAKELLYFNKILNKPDRPFLVVIGGDKLEKKLKIIDYLLEKADEMIIGGGLSLTFLKVLQGINIGRSYFCEEGAKHVRRLMKKAEEHKVKVHLPIDFIVCETYEDDPMYSTNLDAKDIPQHHYALDIGRDTIFKWRPVLARAQTIFWNGPVGKYEWEEYELGSRFIDDGLYNLTTDERKGTTVVAGVDTRAVVEIFRPISAVSHMSDGPETALLLMSGEKLRGVEALSNA